MTSVDRAGDLLRVLVLVAILGAASLAAAAQPAAAPDLPPQWSIDGHHQGTLVLTLGSGVQTVTIDDARIGVGLPQVTQWLTAAARALIGFFGHYPVPAVRIEISVAGESGVHDGVTHEGRLITLELGPDTTAADLSSDWILTHEMFHLAFPDLDERHLWLEEGLATYLEPLARARVGGLSVDSVWQQLVEGLPKGLPEAGDGGLEVTHTWGRTYWGGCLYCLLADCEIRSQSHGRYALDDALRAILAAGGDGSQHWTLRRALALGDHAVGLSVLEDLEQRLGAHPVSEDLPALWRRLGVAEVDGQMRYDDQAPWAAVRRALTRPVLLPAAP